MDRSVLARKPMTELKDIASHLNMRGFQKLRKAELIDAIVESATGQAAASTNGAADTTEVDDADADRTRSRTRTRARDTEGQSGEDAASDAAPAGEDAAARAAAAEPRRMSDSKQSRRHSPTCPPRPRRTSSTGASPPAPTLQVQAWPGSDEIGQGSHG